MYSYLVTRQLRRDDQIFHVRLLPREHCTYHNSEALNHTGLVINDAVKQGPTLAT
jgi:hypothetical protein